jgi:hypothetical protein
MTLPLFAILNIRSRNSHISLWLPLFLIWILLLPLALLLLPLVILVFLGAGLQPVPALAAVARVIGSVSGTSIRVDRPKALISIEIV